MSKLNRIGNVANPFQGTHKRVLCVCSAGLLRSPTAAEVLSKGPFNFNTRAAGLSEEFALVVVDDVLLAWADEVVCMEMSQVATLLEMGAKQVVCLGIEDNFPFRDARLQELVAQKYLEGSAPIVPVATPLSHFGTGGPLQGSDDPTPQNREPLW